MSLVKVFGINASSALLPRSLRVHRQTVGWRLIVLVCLGVLGFLFNCGIPTLFLPAPPGATTHAQELWIGKHELQSKRSRSTRSSITLAAASDSRMSKPKRLALKWRVRAAAAATVVGAFLSPKVAWARTIHRVASRGQEKQAQLYTVGFIALLFVFAWLNSKKEDSSEDTRIRAEVERLVRLKKEFEESEAAEQEGTDDDSMAASLRAAQQTMNEKQEEDEGKDGEAAGDGAEGEESSAGDTGDAKSGESSKSDDDDDGDDDKGESKDDPKAPKSK